MIGGEDERHIKLSQSDRNALMWSQTSSRRQSIPSYPNTLVLADTRVRTCRTCGKLFSNVDDMRKHVSLTHTGSKPVVCQICSRRFGSRSQMMAHYARHREARLQEFAILTKPRLPDIVTEPISHTTVGSFHAIPKSLKNYLSGRQDSYGTEQSFHVSKNDYSVNNRVDKTSAASETLTRKPVDRLPDIQQVSSTPSQKKEQSTAVGTDENMITPLSLPKIVPRQKIPSIDADHISSIDNVMGHTRTIETSRESHFIENTERQFIRSRMEAVSRAGLPQTPKSFTTRSGLTEYRKPKYLVDKEFWDSGSRLSDRFSAYSPVSGYDPFPAQNVSGVKRGRKPSAFSLPSIR